MNYTIAPLNKHIQTLVRMIAVGLVFVIALGLRTYAANRLAIDYDEDDYLRAGQEFAHLIRTLDWRGFLETNYRPEHPQLAKIMFGLSIATLPEKPLVEDVPITADPAQFLPPDLLQAARSMSSGWGALTAALLALANPLGGLLLAIHSFTIKYTSQVMLDGFAALMSTASGLAYYFSKKKNGKAKMTLLILSAIFLGLSASSKYLHSAVGFAILIDWFLAAKQSREAGKFFRNALVWGLLSLITFFLFNPFYWPDPLGRIQTTINAVSLTTTNPNVVRANLPAWQPLIHLSSSVPFFWNDKGFLFRLDGIIFVFALFGLLHTWRKNRFIAIWFLIDVFILLIWRTKWAQYTLVASAPLSFAAAEGIQAAGTEIVHWWGTHRERGKEMVKPSRRETIRSLPWLIPGLSFFFLLTLLPLFYQFGMSTTSLNSSSLRDGLQGGIWREVVGGLSGQLQPPPAGTDWDPTKVHYIGLLGYSNTMGFLSGIGVIFFGYLWTIVSTALQAALGIGAGLLLWRRRDHTRKIWQAIFILPWAIPEAIGTLLWLNIFAPFNGWLALAVKKYGEGIPLANLMGWEKHPNTVFIVMLIAALWYGFPFIMLATSAGLKLLPREVHDAAAIDGANGWQSFCFVTWPMLQPLVLPALLVRAIFAFNQFYLFQMFIPYYGQTADNMATLSSVSYYYLYRGGEFAFSATINIVALILLSVFVLLLNRWSKATEGVTYA